MLSEESIIVPVCTKACSAKWQHCAEQDASMEEHLTEDNEANVSHRNPPWAWDELILALDLYFEMYPNIGDLTHPKIVELSTLLNALPIHTNRPDAVRYRNPAGVTMKLNNFLGLDPNYEGVGLQHGSKADGEVWEEFSQDRQHLHELATAIRAFAAVPDSASQPIDDEDDSATEGVVLMRQHRMRERNQSLVRRKKEQVLQRDGVLRCEACQFAFVELYGALGHGFIECHHTLPLSQLRPRQRTSLQDLALVCANCHRMLHRGRQVLPIAALQAIIQSAHARQR
jgi:5-methylcytosine-specific restriction enzyme A